MYMYMYMYITVASRKRAHGWCILHWAKIGGWADIRGIYHAVSRLDTKECPGTLPMLSS